MNVRPVAGEAIQDLRNALVSGDDASTQGALKAVLGLAGYGADSVLVGAGVKPSGVKPAGRAASAA